MSDNNVVGGTTSPKNVAVLAFPFASHPSALLRFVRSISTLAPEIRFTFFNVSRSNSSLFTKGLANIKPYNISDGLPEGFVAHPRNTLQQIEFFLETTVCNFETAIKEVEAQTGTKFELLITDAFLSWFASEIARNMHVTWVPFWTSGERSLLLHIETDTIREKLGSQETEEKSLDFLPGFSKEFLASDVPKEIVFGDIDHPLARMLHKMGQKLLEAPVVVVGSFEALDSDLTKELKKKLKRLLIVGPLHLVRPSETEGSDNDHENENDKSLHSWLDKQDPASVTYICFGSGGGALPPAEVAALAEALEERGAPFIWSFRGNQDDFPEGFIERTSKSSLGKVVPWVDQEKILNHKSVGVNVQHGGWNSILECITGGVPMIGRAGFADQNLYMRCLVVWGIGVWIDGGVFTKDVAVKALEEAMSLEKGKEMRQRLGNLKQLAEEAVGLNGPSARDLKAIVEFIRSC